MGVTPEAISQSISKKASTFSLIFSDHKAGKILIEMADAGERKGLGRPGKAVVTTGLLPTLEDLNFTEEMSRRCQRLAKSSPAGRRLYMAR